MAKDEMVEDECGKRAKWSMAKMTKDQLEKVPFGKRAKWPKW